MKQYFFQLFSLLYVILMTCSLKCTKSMYGHFSSVYPDVDCGFLLSFFLFFTCFCDLYRSIIVAVLFTIPQGSTYNVMLSSLLLVNVNQGKVVIAQALAMPDRLFKPC